MRTGWPFCCTVLVGILLLGGAGSGGLRPCARNAGSAGLPAAADWDGSPVADGGLGTRRPAAGEDGRPAADWDGTPTAAPLSAARARSAASVLMARSLESIRRLRAARGIPIDPATDPNATGIVGEEFTPLTTSLGEAEDKRTSANPAFAGMMVDYFRRAKLGRGDVVAVGASGSFPALLLATLCAAHALDLEPVVVYSIGSSMYGANIPGFTFVDMLAALRRDGLLPYRFAAVSPGGQDDGGTGVVFEEETGNLLVQETRRSGLPEVGGASLAERIQRRLRIYEEAAGTRPVKCFVNVGGASANFGNTEASLALPAGLVLRPPARPDSPPAPPGPRPALPNSPPAPPGSPTRGLVFEFAARGVPVIHLLHVKGLARENHLPYDPIPMPGLAGHGVGPVHRRQVQWSSRGLPCRVAEVGEEGVLSTSTASTTSPGAGLKPCSAAAPAAGGHRGG